MSVIKATYRYSSFVLLIATVVILMGAFVVTGCDSDTETIFIEKPLFEEPPAAAKGFLGYDDATVKLTVCGNCHVGQQGEWKLSKHADAWNSLQGSGHAQATCENCHTDGPNGNPAVEGGWAGAKEERYHDVQCESCHGPGQQHVDNPDIEASHPLASIAVGDLTDLTKATGCAECHQGTHHPFAEEWSKSGHANNNSAAGRAGCDSCHRGQAILAAWGVKDNYVEKGATDHMTITCSVCHDPHDASNEGQLRFPVKTASVEEHLCARCHDRRTVPDPNSSHGLHPHAPEAALLGGDAGWFPPGVNISQGQIIASHGSEANERLCATCHVNSFTINDQATGAFVFNTTGHLFNAIPCVDDKGIPTANHDCAMTADARAFNGCTGAGCHGTEQAAASALEAATARIERWAEELHEVLLVVDPNFEAAGGEIDAANPVFTAAEGAAFNYNLAHFSGSAAHNPFLIEALLIASLKTVEDTYGLRPASVSPSVNFQAELDKVIASTPKHLKPLQRASNKKGSKTRGVISMNP